MTGGIRGLKETEESIQYAEIFGLSSTSGIFFVLQPWRCLIGILEFIFIVIMIFKIFAKIPENDGREDQLSTNQHATNQPHF